MRDDPVYCINWNTIVGIIWVQKQVEAEAFSQKGFLAQFEMIVFKLCSGVCFGFCPLL